MDPSYEFQITIHPTGDYAYLTVINRHYILRTDYDWNKKEFTTPYIVAGSNGQTGWEDAVGGNARVDRPYQGVFVKNPKYVEEGRSDEYDYYFAITRTSVCAISLLTVLYALMPGVRRRPTVISGVRKTATCASRPVSAMCLV